MIFVDASCYPQYLELSFPDAIGAADSALRGYELATFDTALSRASGVTTCVME